MAQPEEPANALSSTFPAPPPFWQTHTPENIARLAELRHAQAVLEFKPTDAVSLQNMRLLDLPTELRNLQKPEPPADGRYRLYGDSYNLNDELPSLQEMGIEVLYDQSASSGDRMHGKHSERALELKKMAKSLLLNFMELTGILSINPDHADEKVEDIRTLFINFHHLLNEYRPHQARESLIRMMEDQLEKSNAEIDGIAKIKAETEAVLAGLENISIEDTSDMTNGKAVEPEYDEGRAIWEQLEREFGACPS